MNDWMESRVYVLNKIDFNWGEIKTRSNKGTEENQRLLLLLLLQLPRNVITVLSMTSCQKNLAPIEIYESNLEVGSYKSALII